MKIESDRFISGLYLAKTSSREKMMADLILNVMYSLNEPLAVDELIGFIEQVFHMTPIKYEVELCLDSLVEDRSITYTKGSYVLVESTQLKLHATALKAKDESQKRLSSFNIIIDALFATDIDDAESKSLWDAFNKYLLECFMTFGRKAINIFLPYKDEEVSENSMILKEVEKSLGSKKLFSCFKKLLVEYPERLTEPELRYLTGLASRGERFYSLGVDKAEYDKIKQLQIKNLTILADTNILYTVLNLHVHPEKAAVNELIRLAKEKAIDIKIVYIPRTYSELQRAKGYLEEAISREKFNVRQIRAMLATDKLDQFARKYYESKLENSDYPHPSDNITYASDILKNNGITIYNQRFKKLEDEEYLNEKVKEYYEFQSYYNNLNEEKGYDFKLFKQDYKIEHDIFLREAVKALKEKNPDDNELRFICLTADRSLIHFDHYTLRQEGKGSHDVVNPNFMMPSLFINRIRPFIPISTNDYRKAFISALTSPTFARETDEDSVLIQKSMTYFKNLGIEDEDAIYNIIRRELFLGEFSEHLKDDTAEEFIKTEVSKELEEIKTLKQELEDQIRNMQQSAEEKEKAEKAARDSVAHQKEEAVKAASEASRLKEAKIQELENKIKEKLHLESQIETLSQEHSNSLIQQNIAAKQLLLDEVIRSIGNITKTRDPLDLIAEKRLSNHKFLISLIVVAYFLILCYLIRRFTWDVMEQYTYILGIFGVVALYLYVAIKGKSLNPSDYFTEKKLELVAQVYNEFNFDHNQLTDQQQRKDVLEKEIGNLRQQVRD